MLVSPPGIFYIVKIFEELTPSIHSQVVIKGSIIPGISSSSTTFIQLSAFPLPSANKWSTVKQNWNIWDTSIEISSFYEEIFLFTLKIYIIGFWWGAFGFVFCFLSLSFLKYLLCTEKSGKELCHSWGRGCSCCFLNDKSSERSFTLDHCLHNRFFFPPSVPCSDLHLWKAKRLWI